VVVGCRVVPARQVLRLRGEEGWFYARCWRGCGRGVGEGDDVWLGVMVRLGQGGAMKVCLLT
jgi:hypothetical protein